MKADNKNLTEQRTGEIYRTARKSRWSYASYTYDQGTHRDDDGETQTAVSWAGLTVSRALVSTVRVAVATIACFIAALLFSATCHFHTNAFAPSSSEPSCIGCSLALRNAGDPSIHRDLPTTTEGNEGASTTAMKWVFF